MSTPQHPSPPGLDIDVALATDLDRGPDEIEDAHEVACRACGTVLTPVFDEGTRYQFDNALWIGLHGGYGMFTDTMFDGGPGTTLPGGPDHEVVICHDCAHLLCDMVPWLGDILDPPRSHAHRWDRDWTGHVGWDLPHRRG